jgi:hypothetical protein
LDDSLIVFVSAFGFAFLVLVLVCWARLANLKQHQHRLVAGLHSRCMLLWTYVTYVQSWDTHGLGLDSSKHSPALRKIAMLSGTFVEVMQYAVQLLVLVLAGSMVLYLVKALDSSDAYATHSQTYAWFWTLAYMRGVVPAGMLLLLWTGPISACFYRIVVQPMSTRRKEGVYSETLPEAAHEKKSATTAATSSVSAAADEGDTFRNRVVPIGAAFVFNACITITVNMLYIYSTQQTLGASVHFGIQLSLSVFRLLYVAVAFPLLSKPIRSVVQNVRFRFILLTINNLLMVTALTSDACFQVL